MLRDGLIKFEECFDRTGQTVRLHPAVTSVGFLGWGGADQERTKTRRRGIFFFISYIAVRGF
jgi:hypothetical protein